MHVPHFCYCRRQITSATIALSRALSFDSDAFLRDKISYNSRFYLVHNVSLHEFNPRCL